MKTGVTAILVFVAAFVVTTAALIFLNTKFMNIFKFNFTPVNIAMLSSAPADSTASSGQEPAKKDSTQALDSLKSIAGNLAPKTDSLKTAAQKDNSQGANNSAPVQQQNTPNNNSQPQGAQPSADNKTVSNEKQSDPTKMDSASYENWKRSTVGILEAMDAGKASQFLRMYADNVGSDLLYSMKKKKAAEILSKFDMKKDSALVRKLTRIR